MRQSYAAVDEGTGASGSSAGPSNSGSQSQSQSRPLPARNANAAARRARAPAHAGTTGKALVNPGVLGGVSANPKSAGERANQKDKADRATHEQVLDARTRLVLSALVNRGFFGVIDGVVSTGKEVSREQSIVRRGVRLISGKCLPRISRREPPGLAGPVPFRRRRQDLPYFDSQLPRKAKLHCRRASF